jgi:hypothetical protein
MKWWREAGSDTKKLAAVSNGANGREKITQE